jgi:hypothetical protein
MSVERSDIPAGAAGWTLAGVVGLVVLACAVSAGFLALSGGMREARPTPPASRAAPMLQINERNHRAAIEARAMARLEGKNGGAPIDEAMRRTATAGWDAPP